MFRPLPSPQDQDAALQRFDAAAAERQRLEAHVLAAAERRSWPLLRVQVGRFVILTPAEPRAWRQDAGNWSTDELQAVLLSLEGTR